MPVTVFVAEIVGVLERVSDIERVTDSSLESLDVLDGDSVLEKLCDFVGDSNCCVGYVWDAVSDKLDVNDLVRAGNVALKLDDTSFVSEFERC